MENSIRPFAIVSKSKDDIEQEMESVASNRPSFAAIASYNLHNISILTPDLHIIRALSERKQSPFRFLPCINGPDFAPSNTTAAGRNKSFF